jgi:Endonuclease/Exonuclease/phosphatase family.
MRKALYLLLLPLLLLSSCVNGEGKPRQIKIISYNVQNLFDDREDGSEYEEYSLSSGLWNGEKYRARLERFSAELKKREFSSADIIFFEEVENAGVLKDLLESGLKKRGFLYYGAVGAGTPLSIGFISRIKPQSVTLHKADGERAILGFECFLCGEQVFIYALHAKSRIGGAAETDGQRRKTAELMNTLSGSHKGGNVIFIGDFNTDFLEPATEEGAFLNAAVFEEGREDRFYLTGNRALVSSTVFYSPYLDSSHLPPDSGTYYYNGRWYCYDGALLSPSLIDGVGLEYKDWNVINGEGREKSDGTPFSYNLGTGTGLSDHFAISLSLEMVI